MSESEYVCYENLPYQKWYYLPQQKTTKEEWAERFEFVYRCSKEYIALNKPVDEAYVNYVICRHKQLYTDDKESTRAMKFQLGNIYNNQYEKQSALKALILKAFKQRFLIIKKPARDLEHYIECCKLYESHRLKGMEYNLPFLVEFDTSVLVLADDFKLNINKPAEDKPPEDKPPEDKPPEDKPPEDKPPEDKPPEDKPPEDKPVEDKPAEIKTPPIPEEPWENHPLNMIMKNIKSKSFVIEEKKSYPSFKKHTLSLLLKQEKKKNIKLEEMLRQINSTENTMVNLK